MLDETKRLELPAPHFREMSEFMVTFQKAQALRAPEPRLQYQGKTLWEGSEDSQPEIVVQDRRVEQVEQRLIQALKYVQEHGFITNGIYRQLTGVTDRTAHRDLEKLVERGRLKASGQRAARRYVLA
ncbi:MAG TPA: DeoR family transcriptional regulator [Ktedonobacteraceae bacterium]|nr:DeoR family transcriptional regulator [Ktedonobacteraceae bacterium]